MKIIQDSIKDLVATGNVFRRLGSELSEQGAVYFTIESFKFELELKDATELDFTIDNLREVYTDYTQEIDGKIIRISYENSKEVIDLCVYCGALIGDGPRSKNDLKEEQRPQAEANLKTFWEEVAKNFKMPPTDVFIHKAAYKTLFYCRGYWDFCYIFLNRFSKEGIILSGLSAP